MPLSRSNHDAAIPVGALPAAGEVERSASGWSAGTLRRVTCCYFCGLDVDLGLGFVKVSAYFPNPTKVWLGGRQRAGSMDRMPVAGTRFASAVSC